MNEQATRVRDPKIVILYASYGEGHLQVARAIRDALARQGAGRTALVDLMAEAHPRIDALTRRVYRSSYSLIPGLYGLVYEATHRMRHDSPFGAWLHSFGRSRMRALLEAERPDAVIHTFPSYVMPGMGQGGRSPLRRVPACAVVTDFDLHGRWIHPGVDRYYAPTDDMRAELVARGIPAHRVSVTGIPLRAGFADLQSEADYRRRFGFREDETIALVMAGAEGVVPDIGALCRRLLDRSPCSVALVCGRNAALAAAVREQFAGHPASGRLRVFGYVDNVHELMAVSSCLVTKPGGVTLAEGLAAGLPLFLYRPVPGQERRNAEYLAGRGAASIADTPDALADKIVELLTDPARLIEGKRACAALARDRSADTLAMDFLSNLSIMVGKGLPAAPSAAAADRAIPIAKGQAR